MKKRITILKTMLLAILMMVGSGSASATTPYLMSSGNYSEGFADIANWTDNFAAGTGASSWGSVAINASGTLGDGAKITTSTATFKTTTSGGVQKGTTNIYLLSTSTANSCAIDLMLDFTGRNAGTISFDVATVFNSTGNRDSKLKLFYSTDGATFTELTGTNLPFTARNNIALSASITTIALPTSFNNSATARLRFYEYSTTLGGTPTGSQPKISIDNISITSTTSSTSDLTVTPSTLSAFAYNFGSGPSAEQSFTVSGANLTNDVSVALPTNYDISTGTGASFVAASVAIPITFATANAGNTTIYTRLKTGLAVGAYNEDISITSTGATAKTVACTGSVACVASGLAFGVTTVNKSAGNAAFTEVATSSNAADITYSSSVEAVATVNVSTGEVTILTAGSTVITATQGAGSGYCATTDTYTLDVAPVDPTISVVETSIPAMVAVVGSTDAETITVSGLNLTTNISVALSGANADQFSLSTETVTQTGGTAPSTVVTITYTPTAQASHVATVTLTSGTATPVVFNLTASATWAPLTTPVATGGTGISQTGFTANWDTVVGATSYDVDVYTKTGGTAATVTEGFDAGSTTPTDWTFTSIGATYTSAGNFGALSPSIKFDATADAVLTPVLPSAATELSFWMKGQTSTGSSLLVEGYNGVSWVQIDNIVTPSNTATTYIYTSSTTPALSSNTTQFRFTYTKALSNIAFDDVSCKYGTAAVKTSVAGYPMSGITENSKAVTGLTAGTNYYYTVTAENTNVTSLVSEEMLVPTSAVTGLDNVSTTLSVSAKNGKIMLNAAAGEIVNIYNAIGQQLLSKLAVDGLNTIAVPAHGVVIVKVGNRVAKVIM